MGAMQKDIQFAVPPEPIDKKLQDLVVSLRALESKWHFTIFAVTERDENATLHFASSMDREENIVILKQWLNRSVQ